MTKAEPDTPATAGATVSPQENRDPRDAPIERWLVFFPDLLDCAQFQAKGNQDQAALAMLSLPPAADTVRLSKRINAVEWSSGCTPVK